MPIFRLVENNNIILVSVVALSLLYGTRLAAASPRDADYGMRLGDTLTLDRSVETSFRFWEVGSLPASKIQLLKEVHADTLGDYRVELRALNPGWAHLRLDQFQNTLQGRRVVSRDTVVVRIQPLASDSGTTGGTTTPPTASRPASASRPGKAARTSQTPEDGEDARTPSTEDAPSTSSSTREARALVTNLWKLEEYQEALDLIQDRLKGEPKASKRSWLELKARTLMQAKRFTRAAQIWQTLIESYSGPTDEWMYEEARAHRLSGRAREAEMVLLRIRHLFPESPVWPKALLDLASMARNRGKPREALEWFQVIRDSARWGNDPESLFHLARLYDRNERLRDFHRAVKLYEHAADGLAGKAPDTAAQARQRAQYLKENYLEYGVSRDMFPRHVLD